MENEDDIDDVDDFDSPVPRNGHTNGSSNHGNNRNRLFSIEPKDQKDVCEYIFILFIVIIY